ncbi:ankyrin-1-like [Zootermopsis nevadensis]|uniref:ankyrin-1-like n=1 Tax=Zootermopsis nevadensis TaxID=136037 RepID=UPI000B8E8EEB|nr:ankyrin-1-like [Zootermopsis nevadensis]
MLADKSGLHDAVLNNDPEAVNKLLGEETDVNSLDKGGRTALHLAASYNSIIIEKLLSVTGVDTNISDGVLKWTPLRYAAKTRSWMAVDSLLQGGADDIVLKVFYQDQEWRRAALWECAQKGHRNLLEFIMNSGFDVNDVVSHPEYNHRKLPLLHIASLYSQEEVVRLLIERGVDINVRSFDNETALHFAAQRGNVEIMTLLVDAGMSVNETSTGDETPLHVAARHGNLRATEFLVERGADLEIADTIGRTPLMLAVSRGNVEVVRYLTMKGADVNSCTDDVIALLLATDGAHLDVMDFLRLQGADFNGSNVE